MSAHHFDVDGPLHVWIHSTAEGHRAAIAGDDIARRRKKVVYHPTELEALQALRSAIVEACDRRIAIIDAAIAEEVSTRVDTHGGDDDDHGQGI